MLSVWEERKVRLYGEHANVHQSHSQNDSGDLRGVAGGDGELGCLCGKAGTSHLCDGSAHLSGCVVNGSNAMAAVGVIIIITLISAIYITVVSVVPSELSSDKMVSTVSTAASISSTPSVSPEYFRSSHCRNMENVFLRQASPSSMQNLCCMYKIISHQDTKVANVLFHAVLISFDGMSKLLCKGKTLLQTML